MNSMKGKLAVVLLSLILLFLDIMIRPGFFFYNINVRNVSIFDFLYNHSVDIGVIRGHRLIISLDDLSEEQFPNFNYGGSNNLLVVAAFSDDEPPRHQVDGVLLKIVTDRISKIDSKSSRIINDRLVNDPIFSNRTWIFDLINSKNEKFNIQKLLIVGSGYGPIDAESVFSLLNIDFSKFNGSYIIIPLLGFNWQDRMGNTTYSLENYFENLLSSIEVGGDFGIVISVYKNWPTYFLEDIVDSFNVAWNKKYNEDVDVLNWKYRSILISIFLYFFAASFKEKRFIEDIKIGGAMVIVMISLQIFIEEKGGLYGFSPAYLWGICVSFLLLLGTVIFGTFWKSVT